MAIHSLISASALPRIFECPASLRMSQGMPNKSNPAAVRGSLIHEMAESIWKGLVPITEDLEGLKLAHDYIDYIRGIDGEKHIEIDLAPALSTVHPDCGGHADCIIISPTELHCIDLKSGAAIVKPNSIQLKMYLLGSWIHFGRPDLRLFAHIVQPFNNSIPVEYSVQDLLDFEKELLEIINKAHDPFQDPTPSYTACKYCNGKTVCPSIKDKAIEVAKQEFKPEEHLADLPELLDTAELLETWIEAVREAAKDIMNTGGFVAGWSMFKGRKMQKIKDANAVIELFNSNPAIFELKSITALKKSGFDVPADLIDETLSAPSLKRSK